MNRLRLILWLALLASLGFAAWATLRPFDWKPDPQAGCHLSSAHIRKDHSYYWLDLHVKINAGASHQLEIPVVMKLADGKSLDPADITFVSRDKGPIEEIFLKFWLAEDQIHGPLNLKINQGLLRVKSTHAAPAIENGKTRALPTHRW